jgi:hypothetical protein
MVGERVYVVSREVSQPGGVKEVRELTGIMLVFELLLSFKTESGV